MRSGWKWTEGGSVRGLGLKKAIRIGNVALQQWNNVLMMMIIVHGGRLLRVLTRYLIIPGNRPSFYPHFPKQSQQHEMKFLPSKSPYLSFLNLLCHSLLHLAVRQDARDWSFILVRLSDPSDDLWPAIYICFSSRFDSGGNASSLSSMTSIISNPATPFLPSTCSRALRSSPTSVALAVCAS